MNVDCMSWRRQANCNYCGKLMPLFSLTLNEFCKPCAKADGRCLSCGEPLVRPTSDGLCSGDSGLCLDWQAYADDAESEARVAGLGLILASAGEVAGAAGSLAFRLCETDGGCFGCKEFRRGRWVCYECGGILAKPDLAVDYFRQPFPDVPTIRDGDGAMLAVFSGTEYGEPYRFEFFKTSAGIEVATLCDMDDDEVAVRAWQAFDAHAGESFSAGRAIDCGVEDVVLYGRLSYRIYSHSLAWDIFDAVADAVISGRALTDAFALRSVGVAA